MAPVAVDEFLRRFYEREPLFVDRSESGYYGELLSLADVDHIVTSTGLRHPAVRLVRDAEVIQPAEYTRDLAWGGAVFDGVIDADRVTALYLEGATIILEALHRSWPPLTQLCRGLEEHLGFPVQTNVYLTPAKAQGFATHYDTHDVFILQVHGSKHWKIYEPGIELPTKRQRHAEANQAPTPILRELEIAAGDLIYLPRGYPHEAATSATDSVHITIGLLPYTWRDVFSRALDSAEKDQRFRRSLPTGAALVQGADEALQRNFREMCATLAEVTDLDAVLEAIRDDFVAGRLPILPGQLSAGTVARELTLESRLRLRGGLLHRLKIDESHVTLEFHDKTVRLPLVAEPAVRFVSHEGEFVVGAIPDLDDDGKLVLARRLLKEGFLDIARH